MNRHRQPAAEVVAPRELLTQALLDERGREIAARIEAGALHPSEEARLDGDLDAARARFDAAFPEDDAATAFYVANLVFRLEPERALAGHRRAFAAAPDVAAVALEWALELHRAGRCDEAIAPYRTALAAPSPRAVHALLAHCLVATGRLDDAIAALHASEYGRHHVQIERLLFDVSPAPEPWRRRAELITRARVAPPGWIDVILYDLEFPSDWWDVRPNVRALERDLPRMRAALANDPATTEDLEAIVRWRTDAWSDAEMAAYAARYQIALPRHLAVAPFMLEALLGAGSITADDAFARLSPELLAAARAGDAHALRILAGLLAIDGISPSESAAVAEIDRIGCFQHRIEVYCGSMLLEASESGRDLSGLLTEIARVLPDHPGVATYALLSALSRGEPTERDLVDYLRIRPLRAVTTRAWRLTFLALEQLRGGLAVIGAELREALEAALMLERTLGWSYATR